MEAELKIQMKVLNKEQAIVFVYSLEKKWVYFRSLRVFFGAVFVGFFLRFCLPNKLYLRPAKREKWNVAGHTRDFTLSVHVQTQVKVVFVWVLVGD